MAETNREQPSVYLFTLLLVSSLYQFGCSKEICSPGPGFVEGLPGSPDSGSVDDNTYLSGNFILTQFFFPCSGMVTSMNMSVILRKDHFYNETLTMDIILWRRSGLKFVQPQKAQPTSTLYLKGFISDASDTHTVEGTKSDVKVYNLLSRVERNIAVVKSAKPMNVTAGDIMGVSLPSNTFYIITSNRSTVSVINGIHAALQDSNRSAIFREVGDCRDQTTGISDCYIVYRDVRPLIEVEFVPDPTQPSRSESPSPSSESILPTPQPSPSSILPTLQPSPSSESIIPTPQPSPTPNAVDDRGPNSAAVALGCLFAITLLLLIVTILIFVVLFLKKKMYKHKCIVFASNPAASRELDAYATVNSHSVADVGIYECADGPSLQQNDQTQQLGEMSYSHLRESYKGNRGPSESVPEDNYSKITLNYGKLDRKSQYMNSTFPVATVPSMEDRTKMAASDQDNDDDIYAVCTNSDELKEDIYWKPGVTKEQLYNQMSQKKYQEIPVHCVTVKHQLGEGEFGQVCYGEWLSPFGLVEVAVKVSTDADSEDRVKLLQEAAIMGQFTHPRVVRMYGVITCVEPNMIIIEYLQNGNLLEYLHNTSTPVPVGLPQKLLQFCIEICDGLSYLSKKGFIHRDLAARNILLDKDYHCKIADFGMSKHLEEDSYYITKGGRIPLKWTSPEAILYRKYSTKSDVWSYGMVMYEIWSLGHKPFEDYTPQEVVDIFGSGFCLHPPPGCPRGIYSLMVKCWNPDHKKRCEMSEILTEFLTQRHALMLWNMKDKSVSPQADVLGAPLEEGKKLYEDLQLCYK